MTHPGSMMSQITSAVRRLTVNGNPPSVATIKALFPDTCEGYAEIAYRSGLIAMVIDCEGPPIQGNTPEERADVEARISAVRAWKIAHGEKPFGHVDWTVPHMRVPARLARMASDERGAA